MVFYGCPDPAAREQRDKFSFESVFFYPHTDNYYESLILAQDERWRRG